MSFLYCAHVPTWGSKTSKNGVFYPPMLQPFGTKSCCRFSPRRIYKVVVHGWTLAGNEIAKSESVRNNERSQRSLWKQPELNLTNSELVFPRNEFTAIYELSAILSFLSRFFFSFPRSPRRWVAAAHYLGAPEWELLSADSPLSLP